MGTIYGSFFHPYVPLFVMIRGLRLLPIKISISDFYKKDFLGLPSTIISDVFTYGFLNASQIFHDAIKNIILIPFKFNAYTVPMWYLYMLFFQHRVKKQIKIRR
ncbi:hypothetical protein JJC03_13425 [Flavobacterium oreochromis]|uniref:hypothetical protein n=1 Tax=Flavobacterium oreochromis TaxID=2906078 RepID=UPI001CE51B22|nr:hypothetical protein [Flavobacterium oreochromis]QYS86013.1 hypothetical protein JJC03_13425 [Flavobacterium oreochromis]